MAQVPIGYRSLLRLRIFQAVADFRGYGLGVEFSHEDVPDGYEQRGYQGSDDETIDTEDDDAPQRRQRNGIVRQLGVAAHHNGTQQIVDQADYRHTEYHLHDTLNHLTGGK